MYSLFSNGERDVFTPHLCTAPLDYIPDAWERVEKRTSNKYAKGVKVTYWNLEPLFVDTETSHEGEAYGWVYQWAIRWGNERIIGRTARELAEYLKRVSDTIQGSGDDAERRVVAYIHFASYDWVYLSGFLPPHEVFAVKPHKILTLRWPGCEVRCSAILTNNDLETWAKKTKAPHQKLKGLIDYGEVHTPGESLNDESWAYQFNDVDSMHDAWWIERGIDGFKVYDIPLTSTGFVRKHVEHLSASRIWKSMVQGLTLDYEGYTWLKAAYMAGYTHGNRYAKGVQVGPIGHRDFTSSFPARMILDRFPMGKWTEFDGDLCEVKATSEEFAYLLVLHITDLRLKDRHITAPVLSYSKLVGKVSAVEDNGRVLSFTGTALYAVTEIDYELLTRQYTGGFELVKAWRSRKDYLPQEFRDIVAADFEYKCNNDPKINPNSDEVLYQKAKNRFNAYYGMCVQATVQPSNIYDPSTAEWRREEAGEEAYIKAARKLKLPYCWGVWVVSYARLALIEAIETVGYMNWLYGDTDSIFYISNNETEAAIEGFNQRCISRAMDAGAFCGEKYLGAFVLEGDCPIKRLVQLHAKCYAFEDKTGKLNVTIAGVNKKRLWRPEDVPEDVKERCKMDEYGNVIVTNAAELGKLDNLRDGFKFKLCGGTRTKYVSDVVHTEAVNGELVEVANAALILNTEYVVNDTREKGYLDDFAFDDWFVSDFDELGYDLATI